MKGVEVMPCAVHVKGIEIGATAPGATKTSTTSIMPQTCREATTPRPSLSLFDLLTVAASPIMRNTRTLDVSAACVVTSDTMSNV